MSVRLSLLDRHIYLNVSTIQIQIFLCKSSIFIHVFAYFPTAKLNHVLHVWQNILTASEAPCIIPLYHYSVHDS